MDNRSPVSLDTLSGTDWNEWTKFVNQAQAARAAGNFSFAEYLWMAAVEEAEMQGGELKLPASLDGLAEAFWQQGKLRQAEIAARRAFELYVQLLPQGHLDIGVAANNLALIYHWQQKYGQAEPLYKQSLEIKTKHLGSKHPDVAVVLSHYAKLLQETHREEQASHMLSCSGGVQTGKWLPTERMKSLTTSSDNNGYPSVKPELPVTPNAVAQAGVSHGQSNTLAPSPENARPTNFTNQQSELEFLRKKVEEYEGTIKRQEAQIKELVLQSQRRPNAAPTANLPQTADKMTSWETAMGGAKSAFDLGRYDEAQMFLEKAMALAGELQEQDPRRTATLDALGECLFRQEKYGQAEIMWQRSLNTKRQFLGTYHKDVAETANSLARLHYYLARFQEAEFLAVKCIEIYTALNGERSLEVASATHNLATLYHVQGQYELAEKAYKTAVDVRTQILGTEHPDTAVLLKNYADLLAVTGRTKEAEQIHGQATGLITGSWKALEFDISTRLEE
jgi:Tetratricopeptide repeat.